MSIAAERIYKKNVFVIGVFFLLFTFILLKYLSNVI